MNRLRFTWNIKYSVFSLKTNAVCCSCALKLERIVNKVKNLHLNMFIEVFASDLYDHLLIHLCLLDSSILTLLTGPFSTERVSGYLFIITMFYRNTNI